MEPEGFDGVQTNSGSPLYDLSGIQMLSRGNKDFVERMVHTFIKQVPGQLTELEENYRHGNYSAVGSIACKMKPVLDNMGIVSLMEHITAMQKAAGGEINDAALLHSLTTIKTTINSVVYELKKEFSGEKITGI